MSFWYTLTFSPTDKWEFSHSLELAKPKSGASEQVSEFVRLRQGQLNGKVGDVPKCPSWQSMIQSMSAPLFLLNQDGFSFELWSTWGFCCLLTWAFLSHCVLGVQKGDFFHLPNSILTDNSCYSSLSSCWLCLQLFHHSSPLSPHFLPVKPGNSWMEQVSLLGHNDWFLEFFLDPQPTSAPSSLFCRDKSQGNILLPHPVSSPVNSWSTDQFQPYPTELAIPKIIHSVKKKSLNPSWEREKPVICAWHW